MDPRQRVRAPADRDGGRAARGGARADAGRRHRRAGAAATPSGSVPVVVSNEVGKGERPIAVRRYAACSSPGSGQIGWAEIGGDGPIAAARRRRSRARDAGAVGRRAGRLPRLRRRDRACSTSSRLPAPGNPKAVYRLDLGAGAGWALAAAARARCWPWSAVATWSSSTPRSPLRPARSTPRRAPQGAAAPAVAPPTSPRRQAAGVATEDGNQVLLFDLVAARPCRWWSGRSPVLPDVRESVLVDIAFSPAGDTLWVLSGDTPRSRPIGPNRRELRAIRLASNRRRRGRSSTSPVWSASGARSSRRARPVGRALPLASGGAIRLPPERATVFVTAMGAKRTPPRRTRDMDGAPAPAARDACGTAPRPGPAVFRVGAEDEATVAITAPGASGFPTRSTGAGCWRRRLAADGAVRVVRRRSTAGRGRPRPADVIPAAPGRDAARATRPVPLLRIQP